MFWRDDDIGSNSLSLISFSHLNKGKGLALFLAIKVKQTNNKTTTYHCKKSSLKQIKTLKKEQYSKLNDIEMKKIDIIDESASVKTKDIIISIQEKK